MERNYGLYVCQCDTEAMNNYPDISIQIGENVYTLPKESYIHKVNLVSVTLTKAREQMPLLDHDDGLPTRPRPLDYRRQFPKKLLYNL